MSKSEAKPITVQILEKDYLVACPEDEQAGLLASAQYLDGKMREIRSSGKIVGADRIAVMAALNIAHELLSQHNTKDDYHQSISARIRALQNKIEVALNQGNQLEL